MFDFITTAASVTSPKDALDRANFAVQNKLAKFLASGSRVIALRDKTANPMLHEKANALLEEISSIQTRAFGVMGEAKNLQDKFAAGVNLADVKSAAQVARDLLEINAAMDAHMGKVDTLAWEVTGSPKGLQKNFFANLDRRVLLIGGLVAVAAFLYYRRGRR